MEMKKENQWLQVEIEIIKKDTKLEARYNSNMEREGQAQHALS